MLVLCSNTKESSVLLVIRIRIAISPAWYFLSLVFFLSCWRTSCWCWIRQFVCLVYLSDADIVDALYEEAFGRNGAVPGYVSATHVLLLLTLLQSSSAGTVTRRPSASPFAGVLMAHCWRYFLNMMVRSGVVSVLTSFMRMSSGWVRN